MLIFIIFHKQTTLIMIMKFQIHHFLPAYEIADIKLAYLHLKNYITLIFACFLWWYWKPYKLSFINELNLLIVRWQLEHWPIFVKSFLWLPGSVPHKCVGRFSVALLSYLIKTAFLKKCQYRMSLFQVLFCSFWYHFIFHHVLSSWHAQLFAGQNWAC